MTLYLYQDLVGDWIVSESYAEKFKPDNGHRKQSILPSYQAARAAVLNSSKALRQQGYTKVTRAEHQLHLNFEECR